MVSGLKHLPRFLAGLVCAGALGLAGAAEPASVGAVVSLPDPTRPPAEFLPAANDVAGALDQSVLYSASGLQAVILNKNGKPRAVINGETVVLGGKVGEARLVSLTESEAVLQGPNGREILRMTPGIEKKMTLTRKTERGPKRSAGKKTSAKSKTKLKRTR